MDYPAIDEFNNLLKLPSRVGETRLRVEVLGGRVTPTLLRETVKKRWDIVHFIGHSQFNPQRGVEVRLNGDDDTSNDEAWRDANQIAELLAGSHVRLAVFNSCESDKTISTQITGLGQQVSIVAGIPAVVVMRYPIFDSASLHFSTEFYRELFSPAHPGRVDIAMQEARNSLYTSIRSDMVKSFITPVLHLAPEHAAIFTEARMASLGTGPAVVVTEVKQKVTLPPDLIERFRKRVCVPFVGAGLRPPAERLGAADSPTLLQVLNEMGENYPERNELLVAETVSEFCSMLLPRVLQHLEVKQERYELILKLQERYGTVQVWPALRRIASWPMPGIVYTEIDGMMEEAFRSAAKAINRVNVADRDLASSADASRDEAIVTLFNLRGTLSDADSLILTDTDHETLLHTRLVKANADVTGLFKKSLGRSVLFIGVSPVDPAVRRLARLYLESPRKTQGKRYFVAPHVSAGDRAYWNNLDVIWIEEDPILVVDTIDAMLRGA